MRGGERNTKIEQIRITACFLVILNHIQVAPVIDNGIFFGGRAFIYEIMRVNVPLFLLISGFLIFQAVNNTTLDKIVREYVRKIISFAIYVFIPSLIVVIFSAIFYSYIVDGKGILEVFQIKDFKWEYIYDYLFKQQCDYICVHLWYIWMYAKVLFCFPILVILCQKGKYNSYLRYAFETLGLFVIAVIDYLMISRQTAGAFPGMMQVKYLIYIVMGYEIYLFISGKYYTSGRSFVLGISLMAAGMIGGLLYEKKGFELYAADYTSTLMIIITSIGAFLTIYSFPKITCKKLISDVGKTTLYIYLVHTIIAFRCKPVIGEWFWKTTGAGKNLLSLVVYDLLYGGFIFIVSFIFAKIFKIIYENILVSGIKKLVMKKNEEISE